ncbi:hypothetical protein FRC04_002857 [Tulasnella sp. 424]|nr:hypothetical protein FRC04_002857 [Tulasnella sp. 424]
MPVRQGLVQAPQRDTTAQLIPKPLPVPSVSQGSKSILQSQQVVNLGPAPTLIKPDRREAVDKLIITVTADAKNHVIVDITGAKDAAFIRERMFSQLRIPDDDHKNHQLYRTELGEAALGDSVTDDQLMIYCGAWADAKGTLKFIVQRNPAAPPPQPQLVSPTQATTAPYVRPLPAIPSPLPPLFSPAYDRPITPLAGMSSQRSQPSRHSSFAAIGAYRSPNTPVAHQRREWDTAAMKREQAFEPQRYQEARNKEYDSQYNQEEAEGGGAQRAHSGDGSNPLGHKTHQSENVDSSVTHGWVMMNEVFPTPTSVTEPKRLQGMGQRTPSYRRSNTTGAVNDWAGSPPSDGPRFSPASATTPSASRPYPHASSTSYTATNHTLQRSQAVKYPSSRRDSVTAAMKRDRTKHRGHVVLPPEAFDPRMRQFERQQQLAASSAQFYSSPIEQSATNVLSTLETRRPPLPVVDPPVEPAPPLASPYPETPPTMGMQIPKAVVTLSSPIDPSSATIGVQLYDNPDPIIAAATLSAMPSTEFTDDGNEGTLKPGDRERLP